MSSKVEMYIIPKVIDWMTSNLISRVKLSQNWCMGSKLGVTTGNLKVIVSFNMKTTP